MKKRRLTKWEFYTLLDGAPKCETEHIIDELEPGAYEYFARSAKAQFGLLDEKTPIYFGALDWDNYLWTIVNSNVKKQFSLFKYSKRELQHWVKRFGIIKAVMDKKLVKNIEWTLRMGFMKTSEDRHYVEFIIRR